MAERVFLDEGGNQVTISRVVISGQTYPMTGITVVRTVVESPKRTPSIVLGILGVIVLLWGVSSGSGIVGIIVGIALVGLAAYLWINAKPTYHLSFGTAGLDKTVLSSDSESKIRRLDTAINDAIIARG